MGFLAQCAMLLDPFSTFDLNVLQCLSEGFLWTGFKPFSFDVIFPPTKIILNTVASIFKKDFSTYLGVRQNVATDLNDY